MRGKLPPVRHIDPASICEGDTIQVSYKVSDMDLIRRGVVHDIQHYHGGTTEWTTKEGMVLLTRHADRTTEPSGSVVTLIAAGSRADIPLFDLENAV